MKLTTLGRSSILSLVMISALAGSQPLLNLPGKQDTGQAIELAANVACSPARSFKMWSSEAGVESFFAPVAHIGPKVGGPYAVAFFPKEDPKGLTHGTAGAHLLAAKPGKLVAFEWVVFAGDQTKGRNAPPYAPEEIRRPATLPTWVEIKFAPAAGGTHVDFHHYGFATGARWDESRTWFTHAWRGVLSQMKAVCAAHRPVGHQHSES